MAVVTGRAVTVGEWVGGEASVGRGGGMEDMGREGVSEGRWLWFGERGRVLRYDRDYIMVGGDIGYRRVKI